MFTRATKSFAELQTHNSEPKLYDSKRFDSLIIVRVNNLRSYFTRQRYVPLARNIKRDGQTI